MNGKEYYQKNKETILKRNKEYYKNLYIANVLIMLIGQDLLKFQEFYNTQRNVLNSIQMY